MKTTPGICRLGGLTAGLLWFAAASPALAAGLDWSAAGALDYQTGKYGTGARSSSLYVPLTLTREWERWNASITVPFVSQTSDGQITNVGGRPQRARKGAGPGAPVTRSGLGDVVLRGGTLLMRQDPQAFDLTLAGKIKLPTADSDKGLGTGEFDEGLGLAAGWGFVPEWTLLGDVSYTLIGSPPGVELENQVAAAIGLSRALDKAWTVAGYLEGSNALVAGNPAPLDLRAALDYKAGERGRLSAGVLVGLSDGSPDFGLMLGAGYRF